jgi:hypothetical protein
MADPHHYHDIVIDSMVSRLSPMYWPYDLMKDITAIAKVVKDDALVDRAKEKMKGLQPPIKWSGGSVPYSQVQRDLGVPPSAMPNSTTESITVPYTMARQQARLWYGGSTYEFYRFFASDMFEPCDRNFGAKVMADMPYRQLCGMKEAELVAHVQSLCSNQTIKN